MEQEILSHSGKGRQVVPGKRESHQQSDPDIQSMVRHLVKKLTERGNKPISGRSLS